MGLGQLLSKLYLHHIQTQINPQNLKESRQVLGIASA